MSVEIVMVHCEMGHSWEATLVMEIRTGVGCIGTDYHCPLCGKEMKSLGRFSELKSDSMKKNELLFYVSDEAGRTRAFNIMAGKCSDYSVMSFVEALRAVLDERIVAAS